MITVQKHQTSSLLKQMNSFVQSRSARWTTLLAFSVLAARLAFGAAPSQPLGHSVDHENRGRQMAPPQPDTIPDDFLKQRTSKPHAMVIGTTPTTLALGAPYSGFADDPNSDVALVNLAGNLGNDPVRIYEWVRNNVRTEFYFGGHRGAYLTFLERAGNDVDQCALLGALFRAAGYTPEYRDGHVWVPRTATGANAVGAYDWLGVTDDASALNVLTNFMPSFDSNGLHLVAMWVAIDVPGVGHVRFFPSIKPYSVGRRPDLDAFSGYSLSAATTAAGSTAGNPAAAISSSTLRSYLATIETQASAAIQGSGTYHDLSGAELARIPTIIPEIVTRTAPGQLKYPGNILYDDDTLTTALSGIPTSVVAHITLTVGSYSRTFEGPELLGKALDVEFDGDGVGYIRLGGTVLSRETSGNSSQSITVGVSYQLPTAYYSSQPPPYSHSATVKRQNSIVIPYGFGTLVPRLQKTLHDISAKEVANPADVTLTDRLQIVGQQYLSQCDELAKIGCGYLDHRQDRFAQIGFVYVVNGNPVLDVGINVVSYFPKTTTAPSTNSVRGAIGLALGALEGTALQQMSGARAFGTPTLFDYAMTLGRSAYLITSSSQLTQTQGSLQNFNDTTLGSGSLAAIQNLLASGGKVVLLGDSSITYGSSTFGGFYEINPDGGVGTIILGAAGAVTDSPIGTNSVAAQTNAAQTTATGTNPLPPQTTSTDPVDLTTGGFLRDESDLDVGEADPNGLHLHRFYNSALRLADPVGLGRGWTHSYGMQVTTRSPTDLDCLRASADEVLPALLAVRFAQDCLASEGSARAWMMASTALAWAGDRQIGTRAAVRLGARSMEYVLHSDGSFSAPPGVTTTLVKQTDGSYNLAVRHGNTIKFRASDGKLSTIVDQYSNTSTATYDSSNRLQTVTDSYGRSLTFYYDSGGRLYEVDDSTGRKAQYGRTADGSFTYTDPDGNITTYSWDADFLITKITDARSRTVVENDYDFWKRVWQQRTFGEAARTSAIAIAPGAAAEIDAAGYAVWTYFDARGRRIAQVDPYGNTTAWQYDGADHLTKITTPKGATTSYQYDANDNLVSETNPAGNSRTLSYDSDNRLSSSSNFEGKTTTYAYTAKHDVSSITVPGSIETRFTYDTRGRLLTEHPSAYNGTVVNTYAYDATGGLSKITYPDGTFDSYTTNALGDITQLIDRTGLKTTFAYNQRRLRTSVSLWSGTTAYTTQTGYDAAGDISYTIDASGRRIDLEHDALGNVLTVKRGLAGSQITIKTNTYDTHRVLLASTADALNETITYSYDANQRLTDVYDPLNRHSQFSYDLDGHTQTSTSPMGHATIKTYTLTGWVDSVTDALRNVSDYQYDKDGRLTTLSNFQDKLFTWTRDDDARKVTAKTPLLKATVTVLSARGLPESIAKPSDPAASPSISFTYDDEGRLTRKIDGVATVDYAYYSGGLLKRVLEMTGTGVNRAYQLSVRTYDGLNRLVYYRAGAAKIDAATGNLVLDNNGDPQFSHSDATQDNTVGYDYFPTGELKTLTYPDGVRKVDYAYDDHGRLSTVTDHVTSTTSWVTTYTYDNADRLIKISRPNGTYRVQRFDAAGELTVVEEHKSDGSIFFFEKLQYDNDGRITTQSLFPKSPAFALPSDMLAYDDDNRLLTWNSQSVTFDADGNMTNGPLPSGVFGTYTYDARNRLTSAGGSNYRYNADGLRVEITGTGAATFVVDPHATLSRTLTRTKGGQTTHYVYGLGLLYEDNGSTAKQYHFDHLGNAVALTDGSQIATDRWSYSSFGVTTSRTGSSDTPFQFNGELGVQTDANNLLYMRARYYNLRIMRFLNADPIGFRGGLNWYAFCGNNPISFSDPLGLCRESSGDAVWDPVQQVWVLPPFKVAPNNAGALTGSLPYQWRRDGVSIPGSVNTPLTGSFAPVTIAQGPPNPTGRGVVLESTGSFFALLGGGGGSATLILENGTLATYTIVGGGVGLGGKGVSIQSGPVYGVYQPSDYAGWFLSVSANAGVAGSIAVAPEAIDTGGARGSAAATAGGSPGLGVSGTLQWYTLTAVVLPPNPPATAGSSTSQPSGPNGPH